MSMRVKEALAKCDAANRRLSDAVREAFPVGTYLEIPWGRGFVRGWVEDYGSWWGDALSVYLRLQSNDNVRRVSVWSLLDDGATPATGEREEAENG